MQVGSRERNCSQKWAVIYTACIDRRLQATSRGSHMQRSQVGPLGGETRRIGRHRSGRAWPGQNGRAVLRIGSRALDTFVTSLIQQQTALDRACRKLAWKANERAGGSLAKRGGECANEASSLWQVSCPTGKLSCQCAKLAVHDAWAWSVRLANRVRACAGW